MIDALIKRPGNERTTGKFTSLIGSRSKLFANLICVTFSAFDDFEHPAEKKDKSTGIQYAYIGLKSINADGIPSDTQNSNLLMEEFQKSLYICKTTSKTQRWKDAITTLETDPIFRAAEIGSLIDLKSEAQIIKTATPLLKKLSSGHKLILLTITRLVEKLEERSLVLIDEPESHLHPPLLSSFMRALNALLTDRNGVGIIATHSPVVLQEVPRKCVWKLRRNGTEAVAERLQIESFGENVGILTQEVFGLEVTDSGFHNLLKELVDKYRTYEDAIEILDDQIGLEAKAILRTLFFQKRNNDRNR
jgi:AAA domain, putative AbiEii toxin, Type IV TA system